MKTVKTEFKNELECVDYLSLMLATAPTGYSIICFDDKKAELGIEEIRNFKTNKDLKVFISNLNRSQRYISFSLDNKHKNICFRGREKVVSLSIKGSMIVLDFYADESCNPYVMKESQMLSLIRQHEYKFNISIDSLSH